MSITKSIVAGAALALIGSAGLADGPKVYPYASSENYCPDGLQPVSISGVICCGTPNTKQSYQSAMAHTSGKKKMRRHKARSIDTCAEGVKGCY